MRKSFNIALGRKSIATALVAGGLLALSAPAAHAQFFNFFFRGDGLQPVDIQGMLEDRGLELIAPLRRNGAVYVADVEGPRGGTMRLVIDANNGRIVQRFRTASPRFEANLGAPRPPSDMGVGEPDQSAAFPGAPPAVITFGDQQGRAEDATGPNIIAVPRATTEDGARSRAKTQAKHKKIDLTPLAQPASAPAATGVKPPVHADAAAPADAKIAPAPAAAVAPPQAAPAPVAPAAAPAPAKAKPALNDVPVTPLD